MPAPESPVATVETVAETLIRASTDPAHLHEGVSEPTPALAVRAVLDRLSIRGHEQTFSTLGYVGDPETWTVVAVCLNADTAGHLIISPGQTNQWQRRGPFLADQLAEHLRILAAEQHPPMTEWLAWPVDSRLDGVRRATIAAAWCEARINEGYTVEATQTMLALVAHPSLLAAISLDPKTGVVALR